MSKLTKWRLIGGVVLLFNLWLIGHYNLKGIVVLVLTFGFAVGFEYFIVHQVCQADEIPVSFSLRGVVFWRHIVGMCFIAAALPSSMYANEGIKFFIGLWAGKVLIAIVCAAVIASLVYLFFTTALKGRALRFFIVCSWIVITAQTLASWFVPTMISQENTSNTIPTVSTKEPWEMEWNVQEPEKPKQGDAAEENYFSKFQKPEKPKQGDAGSAQKPWESDPDFFTPIEPRKTTGNSIDEIADELATASGYDANEARKRGYSSQEIIEKHRQKASTKKNSKE